ncbi:MAG: hypothetical protein PHV30_11285 [Candidatus Margulisbacteria bacterium]|nr:hypothetical protein [Candidatus Margulisiibacteriota bacterium]
MAEIINLTFARNLDRHWKELQTKNPYQHEFQNILQNLVKINEFKKFVNDLILNNLNVGNVDLLCFLVEEHYPDLLGKLMERKQIFYINKRIANCKSFIQEKKVENYLYAFPKPKLAENDSRSHFLLSVLQYVEILDKDHQTVAELLDTPLAQYEQMIHFISYFPHEKIPIFLEKLSYIDKEAYQALTIPPIGYFKNQSACKALFNLEKYFLNNENTLKIIYQTMQKLRFNNPAVFL